MIVLLSFKPLLTYFGRPEQGPPEQEQMTLEEELHLFRIRRRSAKARERLVLRYLCWAFKIAAKLKGPRLEFDEAVSAANAGLMEAMDGYNPDSGYRFSTYSALIIRRHVINALVATYPVKISDDLRKRFAARAKMDPKEMEKLLEPGEPKSLSELFERLSETPDFDITRLTERDEDAAFVPSGAPHPARACEDKSLPKEIRLAMERLLPLERLVVVRHYYLKPTLTFEQIALQLGKSKVSIREAHDRAIKKLRARLSA